MRVETLMFVYQTKLSRFEVSKGSYFTYFFRAFQANFLNKHLFFMKKEF